MSTAAENTGLMATRRRVADALRRVMPADGVIEMPEQLRPFECDALSAHRQPPLVVAMPTTVEEARAVLLACKAEGVPVVTRGAGTGLSGGALPLAEGVLLNMSRMNRILEIDPANRLARVQPGRPKSRRSARRWPGSACTTRRILRPRSPAASEATWRKTPAACTASSTG